MRDEGLSSVSEPFTNLLTQGMVLKDGAKMSKAKGNTVDPQGLIEKYGADTVRLFMMSAAPPELALEWSDAGVQGAYRFLNRLWNAIESHETIKNKNFSWELSEPQKNLRFKVHSTIKKVTDDIGRRYKYNTAIAGIMELLNTLNKYKPVSPECDILKQEAFEAIVKLLSPITPHICHALWQKLGRENALIYASWPNFDESILKRKEIEIIIQINGKLRGKLNIDAESKQEDLEKMVMSNDKIIKFLDGKSVKKFIYVKGKLINVVI
jgi:leucyl-tRNA synthetase